MSELCANCDSRIDAVNYERPVLGRGYCLRCFTAMAAYYPDEATAVLDAAATDRLCTGSSRDNVAELVAVLTRCNDADVADALHIIEAHAPMAAGALLPVMGEVGARHLNEEE